MTGYRGKHSRVVAARGKAAEHECTKCGKSAADWAQVHGTTGENPDEYLPMCTRCHNRYDRGIPDGKCSQGHDMTPENTRIYGGRPKCFECMRAASRRRDAKMAAQRHADPRFTGGRYRKESP